MATAYEKIEHILIDIVFNKNHPLFIIRIINNNSNQH